MIPFRAFVLGFLLSMAAAAHGEDSVWPSSGSAANPNTAFQPPQFESTTIKTTAKEWSSYNRRFQRDLRLKQAVEAPKVTPHLGPAVPPPEAVLPPRSENAPGGGVAAFTAPNAYIAPGSTANPTGAPAFGSSVSSGFPPMSSGGVSTTGPGFQNMPQENNLPSTTGPNSASTPGPSGEGGTPYNPSSR